MRFKKKGGGKAEAPQNTVEIDKEYTLGKSSPSFWFPHNQFENHDKEPYTSAALSLASQLEEDEENKAKGVVELQIWFISSLLVDADTVCLIILVCECSLH